MRRTTRFLWLGAALATAACQSEAPDTDGPDRAPHDAASPDHASEAAHEEGHAARGDGAGHEGLPLRPIMQQLGANMAGLTHALWLEDHEQMAAFAGEIAEHPHISDEELRRIRTALGPEMDRFVAADEAVHVAATRLKAAVEARDVDQVLQRLAEVQTGCMTCHTQFRQRLRTDQPAP